MPWKLLAVALVVGACGSVANTAGDAGSDAPPGSVTWRNQPADVPAMTFGGGNAPDGTPYCMYTITLKQLDLQLAILPSGQVTSGHVQDLNSEAVVPPCGQTPIAANIAMYQLATSAATSGGLTLTFQGGATNSPPASLVIVLTKVSSLYSAQLTFQRNDGLPSMFEWKVMTTFPLAPQ